MAVAGGKVSEKLEEEKGGGGGAVGEKVAGVLLPGNGGREAAAAAPSSSSKTRTRKHLPTYENKKISNMGGMWLGEWPYSSRTFKWSMYLFWVVFFLVTVAFSTPYWLVSVPSEALPEPKFTRLGKKRKFKFCSAFFKKNL